VLSSIFFFVKSTFDVSDFVQNAALALRFLCGRERETHDSLLAHWYKIMPPKRKKAQDDDDEYVEEYDYDDGNDGPVKRRAGAKLQRGGAGSRLGSSVAFVDEVEPFQDYSKILKLKPDHEKRPIWVTKTNMIMLEAFSPIYKQAYDFVVAIAEPESRPEFIHCYRLTENSLYAAVAVFDTESIIKFLGRLCKTDLPPEVPSYIRQCTYTFGKAKIVLKDNNFYIESKYQEILRELLKNPVIRNARVQSAGPSSSEGVTSGSGAQDDPFLISAAPVVDARTAQNLNMAVKDSGELDYTRMGVDEMDQDDDDLDGGDLGEEVMRLTNAAGTRRTQTVSFQIAQQSVQVRCCAPCKLCACSAIKILFVACYAAGEAQCEGGVPLPLDGGVRLQERPPQPRAQHGPASVYAHSGRDRLPLLLTYSSDKHIIF
jgi:hypothetical protein